LSIATPLHTFPPHTLTSHKTTLFHQPHQQLNTFKLNHFTPQSSRCFQHSPSHPPSWQLLLLSLLARQFHNLCLHLRLQASTPAMSPVQKLSIGAMLSSILAHRSAVVRPQRIPATRQLSRTAASARTARHPIVQPSSKPSLTSSARRLTASASLLIQTTLKASKPAQIIRSAAPGTPQLKTLP